MQRVGRGQLIVAPQTLEGVVEGLFTLLTLSLLLILFLAVVIISADLVLVEPQVVRLLVCLFQGRVVVKLGGDVLLELGQGHLQQLYLQHLLLRQSLLLYLLLGLGLY